MQELVEVRLLLRGHQRQVELIQDLEQPSDQRLRGHLHRPGLLLQHPLAVVVELGLQPLKVIPVLGRLPLGRFQLAGFGDGWGFVTLSPFLALVHSHAPVRHPDPGLLLLFGFEHAQDAVDGLAGIDRVQGA